MEIKLMLRAAELEFSGNQLSRECLAKDSRKNTEWTENIKHSSR